MAEDFTALQQVMKAHAPGASDSDAPCPDTEVVVTVLAHAADSEGAAHSTAAVSAGRFLKAMRGHESRIRTSFAGR